MADEARVTQYGRLVLYTESTPKARVTQYARLVIYPNTCETVTPPEPEPEPECPNTFLEDAVLSPLARLIAVHGDKVHTYTEPDISCLSVVDEDPTLTPIERFHRVHGSEVSGNAPSRSVTTITSDGYNGVLGEMPLGELVLGGMGLTIETNDNCELELADTPQPPAKGLHR